MRVIDGIEPESNRARHLTHTKCVKSTEWLSDLLFKQNETNNMPTDVMTFFLDVRLSGS